MQRAAAREREVRGRLERGQGRVGTRRAGMSRGIRGGTSAAAKSSSEEPMSRSRSPPSREYQRDDDDYLLKEELEDLESAKRWVAANSLLLEKHIRLATIANHRHHKQLLTRSLMIWLVT